MGTMTTDASRKRVLFGDGRDGSIAYSVANSRWEDGNGNALTNGTRWTGVATTTLTILTEVFLLDVTVPVGATLKLGADLTFGFCQLNVRGTLNVAGTITAGTANVVAPGVAGFMPDAGAAKSTTGAGNAGGICPSYMRHGQPGGCGAGGGDGTNAGGSRNVITSGTFQSGVGNPYVSYFSSVSAGTTGAGTAGPAPAPWTTGLVSRFDSPWMQWPSAQGLGGGSGALKQQGGSNVGGAGGTGGTGKLPLRISCYSLVLASTALIQNDGGDATAGSNGVATNASGDISGGGGGGGGGAGGAIAIRYASITDAGATFRSNGGAAGAGGLGFSFSAVARPTSDGGAGAAGTAGVIVRELV